MSRLAIHLNDAGITVSNGDKITYREPGYAYLGADTLTTGNQAFSHARIEVRKGARRERARASARARRETSLQSGPMRQTSGAPDRAHVPRGA